MSVLTESQLKALVDGVWTGQYSAERIPPWLFNTLADEYQGAAISGYGRLLAAGTAADVDLDRSMRSNVYYFAAHKSAQQLNDMHQLMIGSENKYQFVKKAIQVDEKYNHFWFDTEYNVTKRIARSGREWRLIEQTKNVFPKLQYVTVHDANARHEHAALDGIIRPVGDPFWNTYYPPLGWNCRCRTQRLETGQNTALGGRELPTLVEGFRDRVNNARTIWSTGHPYFNLQAAMPAPKAKRVKKLIDKMVKAKIREEDEPFVFESTAKLEALLKAQHPNIKSIMVDSRITGEMLKEQAGNFHFPRYLKNMIKEFEAVGVKTQSISLRYTGSIDLSVYSGFKYDGDMFFQRTFSKRARGICVHHDYFTVHEDLQGSGLSKKVFRHMYKEYQQAKVVYLDVCANLTVGGKTWGSYGFCMTDYQIEHYINYTMRGMTPALKQAAMKIVNEYRLTYPGRDYIPMNLFSKGGFEKNMLNTTWQGHLDLTNKELRDYFENYLYAEKKK